MAGPGKKLKTIREGALSRSMALARMGVSMGARAAGQAIGTLLDSPDERKVRAKEALMEQARLLAGELGRLKGSVMKMGQMLAMVGDAFLPPEAVAALKSLQSDSPPLEWEQIDRQLRKQLGPDRLSELEVEPDSFAAASLGQVHLARRKSDGLRIALKIQYPGVDGAIDGDLRTLRSLLSVFKILPAKGATYDEMFEEVRAMLHQEVDYERELKNTRTFAELLAGDPRYVVPRVFEEYSSHRVLATEFQEGVRLDGPEAKALPQRRRDRIAEMILELYMREVFEFRQVQTDPHFGNYRLRLSDRGDDQLVLLDFGAVRKLPKSFVADYGDLASAILNRDEPAIRAAAIRVGYLTESDPDSLVREFTQVCYLLLEPVAPPEGPFPPPSHLVGADGLYQWSKSDLPKRVAQAAPGIAIQFKLRPVPRESIFLDRKMGGIFFLVSSLGAAPDARRIVRAALRA